MSEEKCPLCERTLASMKAHPEIETFIAWVASKAPGFYPRTFTTNLKKRK